MSTAGSSSDEQGFTLLELIVVMVLIGLTASFAMPKIRSALFDNELDSAVRRFVGMVTAISQEARLKRKAVVLRFDRDKHLFTTAPLTGGAADAGEKTYSEVRVAESVQVTGIEAAHQEKVSDSMAMLFSSRGYADRTAVHFRDEDGDELTVMLSPFLGTTRILSGHVSLDEDRLVLER